MPPEQNSQARRPHYHRGRRGSDRRGPDRRNVGQPQDQGGRDQQDVEQIMREIRARISQRHGIELSTQQIQELAARRLEAILDPRTVNPSLLEQLRRSAGAGRDTAAPETTPAYTFEDHTIYESPNGLLRFLRKLLNPILKLFFNPNTIVHALHAQTKVNADAAAREAERDRRLAEWNALHYEILRRMVTETARLSIEMQALASRVESLGARVDYTDRRVRIVEAQAPPSRQQRHPQPEARPAIPAPAAAAAGSAPASEEGAVVEARPSEGAAPESGRRRRRRRRGRRSGLAQGEAATAAADLALTEPDAEGEGLEADEPADEEIGAAAEPALPTHEAAALPTDEAAPLPTEDAGPQPEETGPQPTEEAAPPPIAPPAPAALEPSTEQPTAAAAPPPFPLDEPAPATTPPSPPRDEPGEMDRADGGKEDR